MISIAFKDNPYNKDEKQILIANDKGKFDQYILSMGANFKVAWESQDKHTIMEKKVL